MCQQKYSQWFWLEIFAQIILHLWQERDVLLTELQKAKISTAAETSLAEYQALIHASKPWWEIFRMFKLTQLPGIGLMVPKDFPPQDDASLQAPKLIRGRKQKSVVQQPKTSMQATTSSILSTSRTDMDTTYRNSLHQAENPPEEPGLAMQSEVGRVDGRPLANEQQITQPTGGTRQPGKRRRQDSDHSEDMRSSPHMGDGDEDCAPDSSTPPNESTYTQDPRMLRCHRRTQEQLLHLADQVKNMTAKDAQLLESIIGNILELSGTSHLWRVLYGLSRKAEVSTIGYLIKLWVIEKFLYVQALKNRARKAEQVGGSCMVVIEGDLKIGRLHRVQSMIGTWIQNLGWSRRDQKERTQQCMSSSRVLVPDVSLLKWANLVVRGIVFGPKLATCRDTRQFVHSSELPCIAYS
jgi:hypothetical protein